MVKVSHHPATFCGHRYCDSGHIMVLVCLVILKGHVITGRSNIVGRSLSSQVTSLPSLAVISTMAPRDLKRPRDKWVV